MSEPPDANFGANRVLQIVVWWLVAGDRLGDLIPPFGRGDRWKWAAQLVTAGHLCFDVSWDPPLQFGQRLTQRPVDVGLVHLADSAGIVRATLSSSPSRLAISVLIRSSGNVGGETAQVALGEIPRRPGLLRGSSTRVTSSWSTSRAPLLIRQPNQSGTCWPLLYRPE